MNESLSDLFTLICIVLFIALLIVIAGDYIKRRNEVDDD